MFWATGLLLEKFLCGFPEPLLSPSPVAALRMLLTEEQKRLTGPAQAPSGPSTWLCLREEGPSQGFGPGRTHPQDIGGGHGHSPVPTH